MKSYWFWARSLHRVSWDCIAIRWFDAVQRTHEIIPATALALRAAIGGVSKVNLCIRSYFSVRMVARLAAQIGTGTNMLRKRPPCFPSRSMFGVFKLIVGKNEEDVGFLVWRLNRRCHKKCCRQQDEQACHGESLGVRRAEANGIVANSKGLM